MFIKYTEEQIAQLFQVLELIQISGIQNLKLMNSAIHIIEQGTPIEEQAQE